MRLDKYIAHTTGLSRKDAQIAIKKGRVRVEQTVTTSAKFVVAEHVITSAGVTLDGEPLALKGHSYIMLHKPAGYVCATTDAEHPTVLDLLPPAPANQTLQIAGRLDIDTTGLVLITSDGQWNHAVTSPNKQLGKRYRVTLAEAISADAEHSFAQGLLLNSETKATKPATLERLCDTECLLTISEGKYHQVKRMFAALGNRVIKLHREQVGAISLDPALAPGDHRPLTPSEINSAL